jgi:quinol-cytochrome oxidoreductase complex cytochrome b subunit
MKISGWLKERFPIDYQKFIEINENIFIKEPIPMHMKKWFYCMGATPLILFGFQIITGILLTIYFVPSQAMAYESVRHITEDVRLGYWIRGIHRWGSNLIIISLLLHMTRVFFTQAYRKPRELNWMLGVVLFLLMLMFSFTGYSLTYNQLSYWATTVGTNLIREVPVVGSWLLALIRGGEEVSTNTLTRFYFIHIWLLPPLVFLLIFVHILILRLHGVSEPLGYPAGHYPFYPHHFYKIIIASLFLLTLLSTLAVIYPPGLGNPADPTVTPPHIKPEWYFFPTYRFLKLVPLKVGIYGTMLFLLGMTFWPFIEPLISVDERKKSVIGYVVGAVTLTATIALTIWETVSL